MGLRKINLIRRLLCFFTLVFIPVLCFAEEKDYSIIPLAAYEFLSLENQSYHSPGGGLVFMKGDQTPPAETARNSLMIAAFYQSYLLKENQAGFPNLLHNISFLADWKIKHHQLLGIFRSSSDKPIYGGLRTFQAALGYGYELVRTDSLFLTLGVAVGLSEFDIGGSVTLPVFPFPLVRFGLTSSWINISFDFLTNPALDIVIAPESKIRMNGSFQMVYYRDIRDFLFDCTLWYRFFTKEHQMGDFAGIGLGIKNSGEDFKLGEKDKMYEMGYYSVYGVVDFSFLQISGGYVFNSRERYDDKTEHSPGNGYFISLQLAWQF